MGREMFAYNQAIFSWREICYRAKFVLEKLFVISIDLLFVLVMRVNAYNKK